MRRLASTVPLTAAILGAMALPALACGGLVAPNGAVQLLRTSTLAAYADGVEHYLTSFAFASAETAFGSIVPLPGVPTSVERGGDWTLQRLEREFAPPVALAQAARGDTASAAGSAPVEVLLQTRIDALDLTVVRGGGAAVAEWATEQGFALSDDAPEVLEHYAQRSPVFLAARFDAAAAVADGLASGDGIPIHVTIPTDAPWVPLRILSLGKRGEEIVEADIYLLTDGRPDYHRGVGLTERSSAPATQALLDDLRSDKGMGWVPEQAWLTALRLGAPAETLTWDLAVDRLTEPAATVHDSGRGPYAGLPGAPVGAAPVVPVAGMLAGAALLAAALRPRT
jgi:hypothetical protein